MSKRLSALIADVVASAQLVTDYIQPLTHEQFLASSQVQDAVIRRIEIIGEGVKHIPEEWRVTHPEIPWRQIARMRDMLIHRYFSVDADIVWQTARQDIPALTSSLRALLAEVSQFEAVRESESAASEDTTS